MKQLEDIHVQVDNTIGKGEAKLTLTRPASGMGCWDYRYQLWLDLPCGPCKEFDGVAEEYLLRCVQQGIDRCTSPEAALCRYLLLLVAEELKKQGVK